MILFSLGQQLAVVHTLVSSLIAIRPGKENTDNKENCVVGKAMILPDQFLWPVALKTPLN